MGTLAPRCVWVDPGTQIDALKSAGTAHNTQTHIRNRCNQSLDIIALKLDNWVLQGSLWSIIIPERGTERVRGQFDPECNYSLNFFDFGLSMKRLQRVRMRVWEP